MARVWKELVYAFRSLARRGDRLANVILVLIVAIGVAAGTSVFAVVDALLIRNLPFPAAEELVSVELTTAHQHGRTLFRQVANVALYEAWRREAGEVIQLAGFQGGEAALGTPGKTRVVWAVGITPNMIALLRVQPLYGRAFVSTDDARGAAPTVLLSYQLWSGLPGADPDAMGQRLALNGRDYRIVGVMPRGFRVPLSIPDAMQGQPEIWLPVHAAQELLGIPEGPSFPLEIIGRVRPGAPAIEIEARLDGIAKGVFNSIAALRPTGGGPAIVTEVNPLRDVDTEFVRTPLLLLSVIVGLLLILSCLNAVNLLMARAIAREREMATRIALGASPSRLVLQWITEGFALSLLGWLSGAGVA